MPKATQWFLYLIKCADGSIYTGITVDLERRIKEHNSRKGAKAVKGKLPAVLIYREEYKSRSTASKRESIIKRLSHQQKLSLVQAELSGNQ